MNNPLLIAKQLRKQYGGKEVVKGFSFEVFPGEIVGLLGANGAGKTTSFYMTIGLVTPTSGSIHFKGKEITYSSIHERASLGMGYLAQEPSIFKDLSVEENLLMILEVTEKDPLKRIARLEMLLDELHLRSLSKQKAGTLSGGQRRRLEITRSLITSPELLLLDEPFANVDPLTIREVKQLSKQLQKKGISILITDHNAFELLKFVDRCYLLHEGSLLITGSPQELLNSPLAREAYFGDEISL